MLKIAFFILSIISVSEDLYIQNIGEIGGGGNFVEVKVDGKYCFVAAEEGGVLIIDVSEPSNPQEIYNINSMSKSYSIEVDGFKLYVAEGDAGVRVINIKDMESPGQLGFIGTEYSSVDIDLFGDYAFVAEGEGGVRVINVQKQNFPREVFRYKSNSEINRVRVAGRFLIAGATDEIIIFDMSGGDSLRVINRIERVDSLTSLASDGRWLYMAGGKSDFFVADIAVPEHPLIQKIVSNRREINDIFISGSKIFLSNKDRGITIMNGLVPFNLEPLSNLIIPESPKSIYVHGNLLFVAGGYSGLKIYRIKED